MKNKTGKKKQTKKTRAQSRLRGALVPQLAAHARCAEGSAGRGVAWAWRGRDGAGPRGACAEWGRGDGRGPGQLSVAFGGRGDGRGRCPLCSVGGAGPLSVWLGGWGQAPEVGGHFLREGGRPGADADAGADTCGAMAREGVGLFAPFRVLGRFSGHVPHVLRYHGRHREFYLAAAVGRSIHTYNVSTRRAPLLFPGILPALPPAVGTPGWCGEMWLFLPVAGKEGWTGREWLGQPRGQRGRSGTARPAGC